MQKELEKTKASLDDTQAQLQAQKQLGHQLQERAESLQGQLSAAESAVQRAEAAEQRLQKELQAKKAKPRLVREFMSHLSIQPDGRLERAETEVLRLTSEVSNLAAELEDARAEALQLQDAARASDQQVEALGLRLREAEEAQKGQARKLQEATRLLELEKKRSATHASELQALQARHAAEQQQAAAQLEQLQRARQSKMESEVRRAHELEAQRLSEGRASEIAALQQALAEAEAALDAARSKSLDSKFQQTEPWAPAESQAEADELQRLRQEVQTFKAREAELMKQLDEHLAQNSVASGDKQCQTDVLQEKASQLASQPGARLADAGKIVSPEPGSKSPGPDADDVLALYDLVDYPRVLALGGGWLQGVSRTWRGKLRQHSKQTQTSRSPSASPPGSKTPKERSDRTRSPERERHMPLELTAESLSRGRSPHPFPKTAKVLLPLTSKAKRSTVCRSPPRLRLNSQNPHQTRQSRSPDGGRDRAHASAPAEGALPERQRKAPASGRQSEDSADVKSALWWVVLCSPGSWRFASQPGSWTPTRRSRARLSRTSFSRVAHVA